MAIHKVVYAGSFDPLTNGHLWMIRETASLFDHLIVAIGTNATKKALFNPDERREMIEKSIPELTNVKVSIFDNLFLVRFAEEIGAQVIVRGLRSEEDYRYERSMRQFNLEINPVIGSIYLMPPPELEKISSSFIKGLVGVDGWEDIVKQYVPPVVLEKLKEKQDAIRD